VHAGPAVLRTQQSLEERLSSMWSRDVYEMRHQRVPDSQWAETTLTPPRTRHGATHGNPEQRKPPRNAGFARPCKPLQRLNYPSS
jgi:hypothetical protein